MARYRPDPKKPARLTPAQRDRLDTMTDDQIDKAAAADPDAPLLTDEQLDRMASARAVRLAREKTGLSQASFAERYKINVARLRDLEQGRFVADSAMLAYLRVIERNHRAVDKALMS